MFDIVPPSAPPPKKSVPASRRFGSARPPAPKNVFSGRKKTRAAAAPPVVKIQWRLPARLRRPVKQEIARQRQRARRRRAIIQFERRPIYSELPSQHPSYQGQRPAAALPGAEQHTGDIYRQGKPELQVPMPPYRRRPTQRAIGILNPAVRPRSRQQAAKRKVVPVAKPVQRTHSAPAHLGESVRDVPYAWQTASVQKQLPAELQLVAGAPVKPPRRRFALPLHFSIFPLNLLPRRRETVAADVKKKITRRPLV